jgi:hypothetical protein
MWARFATYAVGSAEPGKGRLVAHSAFVDTDSYFQMGADIGALTTAIESAVVVIAGSIPHPISPDGIGSTPNTLVSQVVSGEL